MVAGVIKFQNFKTITDTSKDLPLLLEIEGQRERWARGTEREVSERDKKTKKYDRKSVTEKVWPKAHKIRTILKIKIDLYFAMVFSISRTQTKTTLREKIINRKINSVNERWEIS